MKAGLSHKVVRQVLLSLTVTIVSLMLLPDFLPADLTPGHLDTSFDPGSGANDYVHALALQPDAKILVGGTFTEINATSRKSIARLNVNGSLDTSFNPGTGADNRVFVLARQPDGKILIGGEFTNYNGTGRNRIARLNTDGTLDTSFNPGSGADGMVWALARQPDGKILVGGYFFSFDGNSTRGIVRLNSDGSLDTSFNSGKGALGVTADVVLQPDGKILIGGGFRNYFDWDIVRNRIARLNTDGSLDPSFDPGNGANDFIRKMVRQPDGKIIIAGDFTTYGGIPRKYLARINADGTLDLSFDPGNSPNLMVYALALQADGKIIIGGPFFQYDPTGLNFIGRLNADGSLDSSFDPGSGGDNSVWALTLQPDGKILIGGEFTHYNGTSINRIARLNNIINFTLCLPLIVRP